MSRIAIPAVSTATGATSVFCHVICVIRVIYFQHLCGLGIGQPASRSVSRIDVVEPFCGQLRARVTEAAKGTNVLKNVHLEIRRPRQSGG